ncbi:hypothetical protein V5O48_012790 [Marasmius crinis-equi]|uniref:Uncharacterized protein n=1 Tax=Marasmius crinis-equi TaxID=585013 RepID=A0ABR3F1U9_9AGAR
MAFLVQIPVVKRAKYINAPFSPTATIFACTKASKSATMSLRREESSYSDLDFENPEFVSAVVNSIPAMADTDASAHQNTPGAAPNAPNVAPAAVDEEPLSPSKRRLKPAANAPKFLHTLANERNPQAPSQPAVDMRYLSPQPAHSPHPQNYTPTLADARHLSPNPAHSPIPQNYASTSSDARYAVSNPAQGYLPHAARSLTPQGALSDAASTLSKLAADPALARDLGCTPEAILGALAALYTAPSSVLNATGTNLGVDADGNDAKLSVPPIQVLNDSATSGVDVDVDAANANGSPPPPDSTTPTPPLNVNTSPCDAVDNDNAVDSPPPIETTAPPPSQGPTESPTKTPAASGIPKKPVGRPTKAQVEALKSGFQEIDELLYDLAKEATMSPQHLLDKFLKRFALSRSDNPWNTYQSFASAPENLMDEMSGLKGTKHENIYQLFVDDSDLKPTTTQMRLPYQLFMQEHGQDEGKDILAAWDTLMEMDEVPGCQQKVDRKRVFDAQTRRLTKILNMLRNVYQMHFFVIGVGGQVHTDSGLNYSYDSYESAGFAEAGWLKTTDRLLAFFKTHVYKKTMDEYTDQEIVSLAQKRGFLMTRKDGAALNTSFATPLSSPKKASTSKATTAKATTAKATTAKATAAKATAATTTSDTTATSSSNAATDSGAGTATNNGEGDDQDVANLKQVILEIAARGNVTFSGKPGILPWNSLHKDCYSRGIQLSNYPSSVTLPWMMPNALTIRKKGIWGLTSEMQRTLLQACLRDVDPLKITKVDALQIQTNKIPIATVVDNEGKVIKSWFEQDIFEPSESGKPKSSSRKTAIKAECNDEPQQLGAVDLPSVFTEIRTAARPTRSGSRTRSVRFEDEDELEEDEDLYGIESAGSSDYEYGSSPSKRKRANKGKGKAPSEDQDTTPRPKQKARANTVPAPPSKRTKAAPTTPGEIKSIAGSPRRNPPTHRTISGAEINAAEFVPIAMAPIPTAPTAPSMPQAHQSSTSIPAASSSAREPPAAASAGSAALLGTGAAGRPRPNPAYRATPNATTAPPPALNTTNAPPSMPPTPTIHHPGNPVQQQPYIHYPPPAPPTIPGQPGVPPTVAPNTLALLAQLGIDAAQLRELLFNPGTQAPHHATHPPVYPGAAGGGWVVPQGPPGGPAGGMNTQGSSSGQGNGGAYYGGPGGGMYNPGGPSGHGPGPSA